MQVLERCLERNPLAVSYRPLEKDYIYELLDAQGRRVTLVNVNIEKAIQENESLRYLRHYVRTLYRVQKLRIAATNGQAALARQGLSQQEISWMQLHVEDRLREVEKNLEKRIRELLSDFPIWTQYLAKINGIGPKLAGSLIASYVTPARFDTISKFWAYAGMHVVDGKAPRRRRQEKANWSSELRKTIYKLEDSFVKVKGGYQELYKRIKAEEVAKNEAREEPLSRRWVHQRARRRVAKIFLAHLWLTWREMEGLPTRSPWIQEYGGHTTIIPPFVDKPG